MEYQSLLVKHGQLLESDNDEPESTLPTLNILTTPSASTDEAAPWHISQLELPSTKDFPFHEFDITMDPYLGLVLFARRGEGYGDVNLFYYV